MTKYLIRNVDEYRMVSIGRLRFTPGRQMWIDSELFSHSKVQSLISDGIFSVLQVEGLPSPEPEEEPEEVVEAAPEIAEEPEVEEEIVLPEEDDAGEVVEDEEPEFTHASLSSMRVAELRTIADSMDLAWSGLRKAELIEALLGGEE